MGHAVAEKNDWFLKSKGKFASLNVIMSSRDSRCTAPPIPNLGVG
jgi:hypothetical protein